MFLLIIHSDDDTSWEATTLRAYSDHKKAKDEFIEQAMDRLNSNEKQTGIIWIKSLIKEQWFFPSGQWLYIECGDYTFVLKENYFWYNDQNECFSLWLQIVELTWDNVDSGKMIDARI